MKNNLKRQIANKTANSSKPANKTNSTKSTNSKNSTNSTNTTNSKNKQNSSQQIQQEQSFPLPLSVNFYNQLNTTLVLRNNLPIKEFKKVTRKWDYKLLDKQIDSLYNDLKLVVDPHVRSLPMRGFIDNFLGNYEDCDKDDDNVLNLNEFIACMNTDTYFRQLVLPSKQTASFVQYTNPTTFYTGIFVLLDEYNNGYLNFHDYMLLRLIIFSLKQCSVISPSIDLSHFSCSIERAAGLKSFNKLNYKNLFLFGLEISNNESLRNLDFISYMFLAMSLRLYGKINGKNDADININEMRLAIDNNILPARYSRDIVDQFFKLIEKGNKKEGLDYRTFTFFDFCLRLFTVSNSKRPFYLSFPDFLNVINKPYFFSTILQIIKKLPLISMNANSFNMQISYNSSQLFSEDDYLMKFTEIKASSNKFLKKRVESTKTNKAKKANRRQKAPANKTAVNSTNKANLTKGISKIVNSTSGNSTKGNLTKTNSTNNNTKNNNSISFTFNLTSVANNLFILLDADNDGYLTFEDFGHFMQLCYLYSKLDKTRRGLIPVGKINDMMRTYNNYPKISDVNVARGKRLQLFNQNLLLNIYEYVIMFRIDDLVKFYLRQEKKTLFEVELKNLLKLCGLASMPEMYLTKCIRGTDNQIPKYDWECAVVNGLTLMSKYYESVASYLLAKNNNITLVNTVFNNIDSQIQ